MLWKLFKRTEASQLKKRPAALTESRIPPPTTTNTSSQTPPSTVTGHAANKAPSTATTSACPETAQSGKSPTDIIQHASLGTTVTPVNIANGRKIACSLCLRPLKAGTHVKLPCKHGAHEECADIWLNRKVKNNKPVSTLTPGCPACNGEQFDIDYAKDPFSFAANAKSFAWSMQ